MIKEQGRGHNAFHSSVLGHVFRTGLALSFIVAICANPLKAADKAEVSNIRYATSQGYTRVIVDLSYPVEFAKKRLSNPDRLYFDLRNARIAKEIQNKLH